MNITPAILPENFEHVIDKLFLLEGLCARVQIDLCDGVFGLEKTWLPYEEKELPVGFSYEFDLMVNDWRKYLARVIFLGATRVVMHVDHMTEDDILEVVRTVKEHKCDLGLSVSNDYDIEKFGVLVKYTASLFPKVFIQVMGIKHIGAQGQPFDASVIDRIQYLVQECKQTYIQVDGSMNPETILQVKKAGAKCAVVGSYLFSHGDVKKTLEELKRNYG